MAELPSGCAVSEQDGPVRCLAPASRGAVAAAALLDRVVEWRLLLVQSSPCYLVFYPFATNANSRHEHSSASGDAIPDNAMHYQTIPDNETMFGSVFIPAVTSRRHLSVPRSLSSVSQSDF